MRKINFIFWLVAGLTLTSGSVAFSDYYKIEKSSKLSYEQLVEKIQYNNLNSVEDTLKSVKASHPEFFQNYILMYHSRSLQGSSFENPRAILFDRSGHFVFSFNGHPAQRGYDRLEIMQFRDGEHRFEFREITFRKGEVQFSEPNPAKCMVCHQDVNRQNIDPRPNWEPYSIWPGAFGSNTGRIKNNSGRSSEPRFERMDPLIIANMDQEEEKLNQFFQEIQPEHSRYKYLDAKKFDTGFTVDLTQIFANLNFRRVVRIMTEEWSDVYEYLEPAIWGVARCGKLLLSDTDYEWIKGNWSKPEYWNEKIFLTRPPIKSKAAIRREIFSRGYRDDFKGISKEDEEALVDNAYEAQFTRQTDYMDIDPTRGIHHLFDPLGISTADWSMDFKTDGRLAFRERFGVPGNTRSTFHEAMIKVTGKRPSINSCKELGKQAEEKYQQLKNSELFHSLMLRKQKLQANTDPPIIGRCIKCHTSNDFSIPYISFDQPEKLKKELKGPSMFSTRPLMQEIRYRLGDYAKEAERMPMGPPVSNKQRRELIEYLEDL